MASLYEMAQGPAFDPYGSFMEGRRLKQDDQFNKFKLSDLQREVDARPLMGAALQGDGNALRGLAGLDPDNFMKISEFHDKRTRARQGSESDAAAAQADKVASILFRADTPEKWGQAIQYLESNGLPVDDDTRDFRNEELNLPLRLVMGFFTKLVSSPTTGNFIFNQIRQKHRIRNTLKQVYYTQEAITEELVDLLYTPSCDPGAQQVFASVLTAPPGASPGELLPHIQCPLLVLWGEQDPWTPIAGAKIYQDLVNTKQNVVFQSIPQAGHCPHDEKPAIVNPLIIDWLAKLD